MEILRTMGDKKRRSKGKPGWQILLGISMIFLAACVFTGQNAVIALPSTTILEREKKETLPAEKSADPAQIQQQLEKYLGDPFADGANVRRVEVRRLAEDSFFQLRIVYANGKEIFCFAHVGQQCASSRLVRWISRTSTFSS